MLSRAPAGTRWQRVHDFVDIGKSVIAASWLLWTIAAYGLVTGIYFQKARPVTGLILGFAFFSGCASAPVSLRPHYFILVLPAVALLISIAIDQLSELVVSRRIASARFLPLLLLGVALGLPILQERQIFFQASPLKVSRTIWSESIFRSPSRLRSICGNTPTRLIQSRC